MPSGAEFVGRSEERADLAALLARTGSVRGGVAVVVGEAGIGKTALVEQALADAGLPALWAHGRQGAPPLALWDQVLRAGRARGLLDDSSDELATRAEPALTGTGFDRFRRFDATATRLLDAAARAPYAIVLDDLHWADPDSLALVDFLAPALVDAPLVVVATTRPDELTQLPRADLTIQLAGLDAPDLTRLIANLVGITPTGELVGEVIRYTGGSPFFVGEIARLLRASGRADDPTRWVGVLPQGVRSVLARRFARLPQSSHAALTAAALLGPEIDVTVLAAILDIEREVVYEQLQPCVDAGLLDDARQGRLAFTHALVREAALAERDLADRRRLHQRAAAVIESLSGTRAAGAIANHLADAGETSAAAGWAARAGDAAFAAAMYAEAAEWYARAGGPDAGAGIAVKLADALARSGRIDDANLAYADASRQARASGDAEALARASLGVGTLGGGFEVRLLDDEQLGLLHEVLDTLDTADSPLRATLLARLSVASTLGASHDDRVALAECGLAMARRCCDDGAIAYALSAWCDAHAGPRHSERRLDAAAEMLAAAKRAGDPELELLARRFQIVAQMELGEVGQASRTIDAFALLADRLRQPQFRWYARLVEGMRALLRGDLDGAEELATAASELGRSVGSANAEMLADGALLPIIARERGDASFVERIVEANRGHAEAARGIDVIPLFAVGHGVSEAAVRRSINGARSMGWVDEDDALFLEAMCLIGDGAAFVRDVEMMDRVEPAIEPYADRLVLDGTAAVCYGPVSITLARMAAARGDVERAAALYERAGDQLHSIGAPLLLAAVESERLALGGSAGAARPNAPGVPQLRREGDVWLVGHDGAEIRLRHSKGLSDLSQLVTRPGSPVHVFDLVAAAEGRSRVVEGEQGHDLGDVIDSRARAEYEQRIRDLTSDIEEAEANNDEGRAAMLDAERELLLTQLAGALGLGGRARREGGDAERARKAVGMRLRDAIGRVEHGLPELGRHLRLSVHTGMYCTYMPERPMHWRCQP